MAGDYREAIYSLLPPWALEGEGEAVHAVHALLMQAFSERLRQATDARFTSRTWRSANALTGADRGIYQGR